MSTFPFISLLDNDFYKFTMQQAVMRLFPYARARYAFINRGGHRFPPEFATHLSAAVRQMATLRLTGEEKEFLRLTCPYLDPVYLDFLEGYRYKPAEVDIEQQGEDLQVHIDGFWHSTILWEVPLMALISEIYYRLLGGHRISDAEITDRTANKIGHYRELGITVAEFGTRRRYSYAVHKLVVSALKTSGNGSFIGSSNVHLAMRNNTKPIGTHAHEWFMFHAAHYGFKMANLVGLQHWTEVYRGDLGIALSDTYTSDVFFNQFDKMFSKLFDGVRHDSGDPLHFADKAIAHYEKMGIDPGTKTIIFSDALNSEKVARIANYCRDRIKISFGIGTYLTNDVGTPPLNIVIKMTATCDRGERWTDVVKLSDEPGKYTGLPEMIQLAKTVLRLEE